MMAGISPEKNNIKVIENTLESSALRLINLVSRVMGLVVCILVRALLGFLFLWRVILEEVDVLAPKEDRVKSHGDK